MLDIHIDQEHRRVDGGSVPVRWCLTPDTLALLREKKPINPHVLLVTAGETDDQNRRRRTEWRMLVPLEDATAYVQFRVGGPCVITGCIVWGQKLRDLQVILNTRERGAWKSDLFEGDCLREDLLPLSELDGMSHMKSVSLIRARLTGTLAVSVSPQCFAKEPPAWLATWVNLGWGDKTADECEFRRRAIFAFSVQLFFLFPLAYAWMTLLVTTFLLCGFTNLPWNRLRHPLTTSVDGMFDQLGPTRLIIKGTAPLYLRALPLSVAPIFLLPVTMLVLLTGHTLIATAIILAKLVGIIAVLVVGIIVCSDAYEAREERKAAMEAAALKPAKGDWTLGDAEDILVCGTADDPAWRSRLPRRKRVVLVFHGVKAAVCKPFAA